MAPTCYGYTIDDAGPLLAYHAEHLAVAMPMGGVFRDAYFYQPLRDREQFHGLQMTLQPGDVLLISSMRALHKKPNAIAAINQWLRDGIRLVIVDHNASLNDMTPEGRNGINIIRALNAVANHRQKSVGKRSLTDERYFRFRGWGITKVRVNKKWIWVHDKRTREGMKLVVAMRDRGSRWIDIWRWLKAHQMYRCGKRWGGPGTMKLAYQYEMDFRTLEATIKQEQLQCAPSAMPESVPTNKPATELV